jgi:hypothetical protein
MAVMKDKFSAWPETVAYKRMIRTLIRGQQYVPPQQPEGLPPGTHLASTRQEVSATVPTFLPLSQSAWTLGQNANGDLVARHRTGYEHIIAANPEGDNNG